jgi:hypothetical protein
MRKRFKNSWFWRSGCPNGSAEARQIGLLWRAQKTAAATGCPIDFEQAAEFPVLPEGRTDQGKEPGEAVAPLAQMGAEAQQHIGQQGGPNLPFDGPFTVAEEVGQLEGLFEFFKEGFNAPAAAIQVGDGLGAPFEVVGQENHFAEFAVHLDKGGDAAEFDGIMLGGGTGQGDQVVTQNVAVGAVLKFLDDPALQVVLGAGDPEDAAHGKVGEMLEVHIGLVEDDDFTLLNIGAKLSGPDGVMLGGGVHDGAAGQEGLEIEADMAFGGGLAAAMFGPVQGTRHQLDGGRVHDMDEPLEPEGELRAAVAAEAGLDGLQMCQHRPEKLLGHLRITGAVGVGKSVLGRRRGSPHRRQRAGVQSQRVAHVVEAEAVGDLGVEQADDVAPGGEIAPLIFDAGLPCQLGHQMRWNEVANLPQERELAGGWLGCGFLFHALPCGRAQTRKPTFFHLSNFNPVGQQ